MRTTAMLLLLIFVGCKCEGTKMFYCREIVTGALDSLPGACDLRLGDTLLQFCPHDTPCRKVSGESTWVILN